MRLAIIGFVCVVLLVMVSFVRSGNAVTPVSLSDGAILRAAGIEGGVFPPAIVAEAYGRLTKDPSASGVAAVIQAREYMRSRGPHDAINFYNSMLVDSKDIAVLRAIHFELASLYKETGQQEKAMEQLKIIMTNTEK